MNRYVAMPRPTPLADTETARVAVLDIGSSKIACAVAEMRPVREPSIRSHRCAVLAFAEQRSAGVKSGLIVDASAAAETIRNVVEAAEKDARATVTSVIVGTTCGRLASERLSADVPLGREYVRDTDVREVFAVAARIASGRERVTLHALPAGFALDGHRGVVDPVGMRGQMLTADLHLVTAEAGPIANLIDCVESCQLAVEAVVAAPYASALCVLQDDEIEHGATVIDLGGGTTTMACFDKGGLTHVDAFALGGEHITRDIGRVLRKPMTEAERIKVLQGNAFAPLAELDMYDGGFDIDSLSAEEMLGDATRSRAEEIFDLARRRLDERCGDAANGRVVLTGGGSQLAGMAELATHVLRTHVRIGEPVQVHGAEALSPATGATALGLCHYAGFSARERHGDIVSFGASGYWSRLGQWIRESF